MQQCPQCKNPVNCESSIDCWCANYPQILPMDSKQSCLCSSFMQEKIIDEIESIIQKFKTTSVNDAVEFQSLPVQEGFDYTIENDHWVFSSWYLLRRGHCCENGCKNCPYGDVSND